MHSLSHISHSKPEAQSSLLIQSSGKKRCYCESELISYLFLQRQEVLNSFNNVKVFATVTCLVHQSSKGSFYYLTSRVALTRTRITFVSWCTVYVIVTDHCNHKDKSLNYAFGNKDDPEVCRRRCQLRTKCVWTAE